MTQAVVTPETGRSAAAAEAEAVVIGALGWISMKCG